MLKVKIESEEGITYRDILVIDAHSHLGKDIDGAENLNPGAPGGTFDFWSKTQGLIEQNWEKNGGQSIETKINGKDYILTYSFQKMPFIDSIFKTLEKIQSSSYKDLAKNTQHQHFIDQAVVFPFQDVFRDKMPEAQYHASNINVMRYTTRFPYSLRLIGYMRCNPMEGEKALKEIDFGFKIGARGLKLHPRSDGWFDNINSNKAINTLIHAAKYSFPVIFDTRGKSSILAIGELIKATRNYIQTKSPKLLKHFKVIIAHFAQGNVGDDEVYETICQPNTWGDLSMLHGQGAYNFFKSFKKWFVENNMKQRVDGRDWSQFLLFASDFPYFGAQHAKGLIIPLLSNEFFKTGGTIQDIENILGLNQLRLLPEYNYQIKEKQKIPSKTALIIPPNSLTTAQDIAVSAIAKLIDSNFIDIHKILFQFDGNYSNFKGELLLALKNKQDSKKIINFVLMNIVPGKLSMLSTLSENSVWKKFGYKYFNPDDREFFHSKFSETRPISDENSIIQTIQNVFTIIQTSK
ncbi:MAG: amidohydrolase family protein [Promethearchaeota archaeon]